MTDLDPKQVGREPMEQHKAFFTYDEQRRLYYFAPLTRTPGSLTQRHVEAIIDIAPDGTLAGVELIDNMPPLALARMGGAEGRTGPLSRRAYKDDDAGPSFDEALSAALSAQAHAPAPDGVWVSRDYLEDTARHIEARSELYTSEEEMCASVVARIRHMIAAAPSQPAGETTEHTIDGAQVGVVYATPSPDAIRRLAIEGARAYVAAFKTARPYSDNPARDEAIDAAIEKFRSQIVGLLDALAAPAKEG